MVLSIDKASILDAQGDLFLWYSATLDLAALIRGASSAKIGKSTPQLKTSHCTAWCYGVPSGTLIIMPLQMSIDSTGYADGLNITSDWLQATKLWAKSALFPSTAQDAASLSTITSLSRGVAQERETSRAVNIR
jgi:hypothetical protein